MKKTLTLLSMAILGSAFAQTVALPIGFESNPPAFTPFGNSTYAIMANPDASGINTTSTVLQTVHGNETWAGLFVDLTNKLDFTTDTVIRVMVWAPTTGSFRLKLEDKANSAVYWEADQAVTVDSAWTQLTWNLSGVGTLYDRVVLFPGWGVSNAGTFYVDNIQQGYGSAAPTTANIVFRVDMSLYTGSFTTPEVNGTFNGWCGNCAAMSDANGDNIWEKEITLPIGDTVEYKFSHDNWTGQEMNDPTAPCTNGNTTYTNRVLVITANDTLDAVCWGSCTACSGIGMDEELASVMTIAPNPANDNVNIALNAAAGRFAIMNLAGQVVASGSLVEGKNEVSTATLANGIYMVRVSSEAGEAVEKLAIRH
ncbi:MAG TPA: hypothetical protein DCE58_06605 [Cryomorphaceae bacterium]|nr:hypothetical protein [Cryomorphaceae bacterium]